MVCCVFSAPGADFSQLADNLVDFVLRVALLGLNSVVVDVVSCFVLCDLTYILSCIVFQRFIVLAGGEGHTTTRSLSFHTSGSLVFFQRSFGPCYLALLMYLVNRNWRIASYAAWYGNNNPRPGGLVGTLSDWTVGSGN
jgi:hypothetical protein